MRKVAALTPLFLLWGCADLLGIEGAVVADDAAIDAVASVDGGVIDSATEIDGALSIDASAIDGTPMSADASPADAGPLLEYGWPTLFPSNITYPPDRIFLWQLDIDTAITVEGFGIISQSDGINAAVGVFADNGSDQPVGSALAYADIVTKTGLESSFNILTADISAGTYWLALLTDSTITVRESDQAADAVRQCDLVRDHSSGLTPAITSSSCVTANFPINLILYASPQ